MNSNGSKIWEEYCSEERLLSWLGINKNVLDRLRSQGFPYVKLSKKERVYHLPSVCEYLSGNQIRTN